MAFDFAIPRARYKLEISAGRKPTLRKVRRAASRGALNRRIVIDQTIDGVEYRYHATKGWRVKRIENFNPEKGTDHAAD